MIEKTILNFQSNFSVLGVCPFIGLFNCFSNDLHLTFIKNICMKKASEKGGR